MPRQVSVIDEFRGIRNTVRPERQPFGALAEATNIVIDETSTLERRDGYVESGGFTDLTAAYATYDGRRLFLVDNGGLHVRNATGFSGSLGTVGTEPLYWAEWGDTVYYAGATQAGQIERGVDHRGLRVPIPSAVNVTTQTGVLSAGQYQVTAVYRNTTTGIEGAAGPFMTVLVDEGSALRIEAPTAPSGYTTDVYVSPPDAQELYFVGTLDGGVIVFNDSFEHYAKPLSIEQVNGASIPTGVVALAAQEAKLFAAIYDSSQDTSFVFWSRPYWPWIFNLKEDFFPVPFQVTGMMGTPEGVIVGTRREIYLYNDGQLKQLADYGMPPGYPIARDKDGVVAMWTERGVVTFPSFTNQFESKLSVPPGSFCSTALVNRKGQTYAMVMTNLDGVPFNAY